VDTQWIIIIAIGAVVIISVLWGIGIYNKLVGLRNRLQNAFSQIDVQLKRRYDLIPNLVETAKGYLKHERETLEAVINARSSAVSAEQSAAASPSDPAAMKNLMAAEAGLTGALGRLLAVVEQYPDLKANQNMIQLSEELSSTENRIAFARQAFNDSVNTYNTYRQSFPPVVFAGMFGFRDAEFFEVQSAAERETPKVTFS